QCVQLVGNLLRAPGPRAGFAPAEAGPVVRADAGCHGDLRLDGTPIEGERAQPGIEHDSWASLSDAVQMQAVAVNVHQLSGRWIALRVANRHDRLVGRATGRKENDQRQ